MTIYLNLENEDTFERFVKKYDKVLKGDEENFSLIELIEEFQEEEDELSST